MDVQLAERPRPRHGLSTDRSALDKLEERLGQLHTRQRLGIEDEREARMFWRSNDFFHPEKWYLSATIIRTALMATGLYWRARKNAEDIKIQHHDIHSPDLPASFEGFTILHLSDLHADLNDGAMCRLIELLPTISYDICVLTGDYRAKTFGSYRAALDGLARVCAQLVGPVYGVLGNHDTIRMVPALEELGVLMLLNEATTVERGGEHIHLVGIDDAHYYRVDNIEKAASAVPAAGFSILLSHTPEIYRQAAHAGFNLLLSGHTHGGQICLPGAIPVTLDSVLPRRMGSGAWTYHGMTGYTSVGVGSCVLPVRLNCPPEITLHRLLRGRCPPQYGRSRSRKA
ncbi:MAG: metallophosphoesterase family protein [Alphaproteobacteria bacterium]|nr:metallophosphoesterase family protein [Alphaproteobacteria bacterium]